MTYCCMGGMNLDEFVLHICIEENNNVTYLLTTPPHLSMPESSLYQKQRRDLKLAVVIRKGIFPEKKERKTTLL